MSRIAYLGPEGTFSEEAAMAFPGGERVPVPTVADAVLAVGAGHVDRAVVPIENALEGPVGATLDTLATRAEVTVTGELVLPVHVHLVAAAALPLDRVRRVLSHPQPLAQCARFLRERLPAAELVATSSTADAVRRVAEGEGDAALGTRRAAELYGGILLAEDVEDEPGNATRFVLVAPAGTAAQGAGRPWKTSLSFWGEGDESPGWLVRCLSEFAFRGVNLTKIESRPLRDVLGHYRFFVDCDGALADELVGGAVEALRAHCREVRVLGTYPAAG